jgi:endonuclease/exonuclease/phosphatase family metal-dependent hydrolase
VRTAILLAGLWLVSCSDSDVGGPNADGPASDLDIDGQIADSRLPDARTDSAAPDAPPTDGPAPDVGPAPDGGPAAFRVATLNCHCLIDSPATRAKGIAAEIDQLKLHAVGLQEVCQSVDAGGSDNFAQALAVELQALTGVAWEHRFAKTHVSWNAYDEGVGLLVPAGQVLDWGEQGLPQGAGPFPRKVIWAKVGSDAGPFYLYSTHLTISSDPLDREAQAKAILALVSQHATSLPQVVVGDFNDWYASPAVSAMKLGPPAFTESWGAKHPGAANPGLTCCYPSFASRIDYIFVKSSALSSLDQVALAFDQLYQGAPLSDHRGLYVQLTP